MKNVKILKQITASNIELNEYPFKRELAMEAYLLENEEILKLDNNDFSDVNVLDAEIALKNGQKTSNKDGRIDILAKYGMDYLAIVELKINEINQSTLDQLEDYLSERQQLIEKYPEYWNDNENIPQWIGVMVGDSISPELQRKLQDGYKTECGISIAGMVLRRFKGPSNEVYVISDTYFNYNYTNRDFSKFEFKGISYNKSRLVNRVIKDFVEKNPTITYAELENFFPSWIQGSTGVFTTKKNAKEIYERTGHKRFYINADELIKISDETIATSNQWGVGNINRFIDNINKLDSEFNIKNI